jgi:hypothetical protein
MTTSSLRERATVSPHRIRWFALLVLLVGIGIGAAITGVILTRADDQPGAGSAAPLSQVQASCRGWMSSAHSGLADDQWCTDMFAWMGDQSGGSMMGSMMWQGPQQMGASCREWVDQDRGDTGSAGQQRCHDMIDWMDAHMPNRGGNWMRQDR